MMTRRQSSRSENRSRKVCCLAGWVLTLGLILPACGSDSKGDPGGDGGCTRSGKRELTVVGNPNRNLQIGTGSELQVVLVEKCVGGLRNESITYQIQNSKGDASLAQVGATSGQTSPLIVSTQESGIAAANLLAGTKTGSLMVWAHHPSVPEGVFFSISIRPVRHQILREGEREQFVPVNQAWDLNVRVTDADSNEPVGGVGVKFSITDPGVGNAKLRAASATTNLTGGASIPFLTGTITTTYTVVAEGEQEELGKVDFLIHVTSLPACQTKSDCPMGYLCQAGKCIEEAVGTECAAADQCPSGYTCEGGMCRPEGSLPGNCDGSSECPPGYYCENHSCYRCDDTVRDPKCTSGQGACQVDTDCPQGYSCQNGVCVPDHHCQFASDCPERFHCENGECVPDTPSGGCSEDADCPPGSKCSNGVCVVDNPDCSKDEDCPPGYKCENGTCVPDTPSGCQDDQDCPPGYRCLNGVCTPDNPGGVVLPDLSGTWYTHHTFDLRNALLGIGSMQGALDLVNKAINFCKFTGNSMVDDILCGLVHQYVPEWVGNLIRILTNLSYVLSELRVDGEMELVHLNPKELVSGTENWTRIMVRYLDACCEGRGNKCVPYNEPDFPYCATIDIAREDLRDLGKVGLEVKPFNAKIQVVTQGHQNSFQLVVSDRKVNIEYSKFVSYLVDLMIQIFTGYEGLKAALDDLIDCSAIQAMVEDLWASIGLGNIFGGVVPAPDIRAACNSLKPKAADLIGVLLKQIGVGWKILNFSGQANVTVQDGDPPWGMLLGSTEHEKTKDGSWHGHMTIIVGGSVSGSWYAER